MERANVDRLSEFQIRKEIFYAGNQVDERKWYKHFNNSGEGHELGHRSYGICGL